MRIQTIFLPANTDFSYKDKRTIEKIIQQHARNAAEVLPFRQRLLTLTVYPWLRDGVNAFTQASDWIRITINPKQFSKSGKRRGEMIERLIYIIYHEMHHAARGYAGFLPMEKHHVLMNSILSEGLANVFAQEQYSSPYVKKVTMYHVKQVRKWIPRLRKIKWQKEFYDPSWLQGGRGKPKRIGYKIGTYILRAVKNRHPRLNAVKLAHTNARKILKYSGVGL